MDYLYYPGCSSKGNGIAYEESLKAVFDALDVRMDELPDWNCCGATSYMSVDEWKAVALAARNLGLAERQADGKDGVDMIAACSACYLGLIRAQRYITDYPELGKQVTAGLEAVGISFKNRVRIRHPLDVLMNDIGTERIASRVKHKLAGMKVACYYGCQIVRPYATFDDQQSPVMMDRLMAAIGAETVNWPLKTRCCGGSLSGTVPETGLRLSFILLKEAKKRGADVVATACPLCQFNLECNQGEMRRLFGESLDLPVVYFTQLMGLAFGLPSRALGIQRLFIPLPAHLLSRVQEGGRNVRV